MSTEEQQVSRQRLWQRRKVADGRCSRCGKKRGASGTAIYCRRCADLWAAYLRARRSS